MKQKRANNDKVMLEMTPMIDVVFQLLIFFIVALKQEDICSSLESMRPMPPPPNTEIESFEPIVVSVGRGGYFFQGTAMTELQLEKSLGRMARTNPNSSIIIKCTGDSPHGSLVRALDVCRGVGLRKLSVVSQ